MEASKALILADEKIGTYSQAINLAKELDLEVQIINLKYSFFAKFPNFLFKNSLLQYSKQTSIDLKNLSESLKLQKPKVIISSGRRSVLAGLFLKQQLENQPKIIQIMNPNYDFSKFDLIILPKHDNIEESKNVITTIGSLTKIDDEKLKNEKEKFAKVFAEFPNKKIVVLLGGSTKNTEFEIEIAKKLATSLSIVAQNMNYHLIILNSRRTPKEVSKIFENHIDENSIFFDWEKNKNNNPYLASLGYGDFFVVTGDSVSMISECCSTNKSVYIFDDKSISSKKHKIFHQELYKNNNARSFDIHLNKIEKFEAIPLNECQKIGKILKEKNFLN